MAIDKSIDGKFEAFLTDSFSVESFQGYLIDSFNDGENSLLTKLTKFIYSFKSLDHRKYILRKILYYVKENSYDENETFNKNQPDAERRVFEKNKTMLLDELAIIADEFNVSVGDEHLTKEEFNELARVIKDISTNLYELITKQNAANEVIYNSVEELRGDLTSIMEKSRIFGKEFTITNLVLRIAMMTGKSVYSHSLGKGIDHASTFIKTLSETPINRIH